MSASRWDDRDDGNEFEDGDDAEDEDEDDEGELNVVRLEIRIDDSWCEGDEGAKVDVVDE
jgi:hypothetical protein